MSSSIFIFKARIIACLSIKTSGIITNFILFLDSLECEYGNYGYFCQSECGRTVTNLIDDSFKSVAVIYVNYTFNVMIAGNFVTRSLSSTCLGTLINKTTVLTASRCYSSSIQYVENNMQFTIWQPTIVQNIVFFNARYFDEHLLPAADKYEIESFKVIHISLVILVKHYLIKI